MWNAASVTNFNFYVLQQVTSQSTVYLKGKGEKTDADNKQEHFC